MSAIKTSESRLLSLPNEILSSIIKQLARPDLKNLRLSSSSVASLPEPILFEVVTVVPHEESLKGLIRLSEHSRIKRHVKTLHYDNRCGNIALELLRQARRWPNDGHSNDGNLNDTLDQLSRGTFTEKEAQIEVAYLSRALSSLPSLTGVRVWDSKGYPYGFSTLPSFYGRLYKLEAGDRGKFSRVLGPPNPKEQGGGARSVFVSLYAITKSVQDLRLDGFNFPMWDNAAVTECMVSVLLPLRKLTLDFRQTLVLEGQGSLSKLGSIFCTLLHLEDLELISEEDYDFDYADQLLYYEQLGTDGQSTCSQLFPSPIHFPHLKRLSLGGLIATEDELVVLLERHAPTLFCLTLNGGVLVKAKTQDATPCWIRTFKAFQTCLNLKEMHLEGRFINGSNQDWLVKDTANSKSIKARMEGFIVNGVECPLEDTAAERLQDSALFTGDASWANMHISESTDDSESDSDSDSDNDSDNESDSANETEELSLDLSDEIRPGD